MPKWQRQRQDHPGSRPTRRPTIWACQLHHSGACGMEAWGMRQWQAASTARRRVSLSVNCCSFTFWVWLKISTNGRQASLLLSVCLFRACVLPIAIPFHYHYHFCLHLLFKYLIKPRQGRSNFFHICPGKYNSVPATIFIGPPGGERYP